MWNIKKYIVFFTCILLLLAVRGSSALAGFQDVSAIKAMQLFDSGNYGEAERFFRVLLDEDPGNPMLNYYYGASRTETGHFGDDELECLLKAGKNVIPDRLHYYLGMQYHARNDWDQALKYYNQFRLSVPENEQKNLNLAQKIQQCFDLSNPFQNIPVSDTEDTSVSEPEDAENHSEEIKNEPGEPGFETDEVQDSVGMILPDNAVAGDQEDICHQSFEPEKQRTAKQDELAFERKLLPDLPGVRPTYPIPAGKSIEFHVNNQITYLFSSQFQTAEGRELFEEGSGLQDELNRLLNEAEGLRVQYRAASDPEEREKVGEKILLHESDAYNLQEKIKKVYTSSREHENNYWAHANPTEKYNFLIELEKIKAGLDKKSEVLSPEAKDTLPVILPGEFAEIYKIDAGVHQQRKTGQLIYKIQIGAYSRSIPASRQKIFNKLSLIRKIDNHTDEKGTVIYTTGNLNNLEDAIIMQSQVKQEGIEDAIIIPFYKGKRVTLEQAKKIEAGDDIERN